jgi:hypothetical protein
MQSIRWDFSISIIYHTEIWQLTTEGEQNINFSEFHLLDCIDDVNLLWNMNNITLL